MNAGIGPVTPFAFDMSALVGRSVASLYSHLVTRPTGKALRLGIESQIGELGTGCISVLDFTQVVVLDYSCADEAIAKLIQRFQSGDYPTDVYFVARGLGEHHRDPIDEVLRRHGLLLVGEMRPGGFVLLGDASTGEQRAWRALEGVGAGTAATLSERTDTPEPFMRTSLDRLAARRVALRRGNGYQALSALL